MNKGQIEYIHQKINELREIAREMDPKDAEPVLRHIDELEEALDDVALHWVPINRNYTGRPPPGLVDQEGAAFILLRY